MSCCTSNSCSGTNIFFSRWSKSFAKRFRKKGLEKVQRYLLEGIRLEPVKDRHILDIGCGVGALHLTLLQEGAILATGIEAAEGMLEKAKEFSLSFGLQEKISYHLGDFVSLADTLPDAEITVMDKVVCCYENLDQLIETSTKKTKRMYGLTHPRNNILIGSMFRFQIAILKLFRFKFHPFWHDWDLMHKEINRQGFRLLYQKSTFVWNVAVFQRI